MGGPLKNPSLAALQSRSRFCEGSMNDRASAAPPVRFLGPDALAALEQPLPISSSGGISNPRPSHDTAGFPTSSSGTSGTSSGSGFSQAWSRKTGSKLFGQVWEGVRGRLRLRKPDDSGDVAKKTTTTTTTPSAAISAATTTTAVTQTNADTITIYTDPTERDGPPASRTRSRLAGPAPPTAPIDIPCGPAAAAGGGGPGNFSFAGFPSARPSRDEVLASYQQLMADGFFRANAIPSSRQGLSRPGTASSARPATAHHHQRPPRSSSPPPEWPLATPRQNAALTLQSPTSASSRGTKRAAAHDSDDDESMRGEDMDIDDDDNARVYDKENQAPPHPNTVHDDARQQQPKKRLRRLPSRESLFVPKTRASSSSSSTSFSQRSLSAAALAATNLHPAPPAAINKLQKRRPSAQQHAMQRPRHVSDGGGSARLLRGKAAEERRRMRVVPDEGRGIPGVPAIPVRFTYGEDRENDGPWRGLRVR